MGGVLLQGSQSGPPRTQMEGDGEPRFSRSVGRLHKPWGDTLMLLPEAGRGVRRRSKSENSSASVSNPPTTVRGSRWHSASLGPRNPRT